MKTSLAYKKYKSSGIEWLGKIPEGWKIIKLKYVATIQTGNTPSKTESANYEESGIPWVKPDDLGSFRPIISSKEKLSSKGAGLARVIPKNSNLVCCIGTVGKIGVSGCVLATNQQINSIMFSNQKIENKYGQYLMLSTESEHMRLANKNVVAILNSETQKSIVLPFPAYEEQRAIAEFLDRETGRIDALIEKKERQIELLKEKRTALITHAVTKGLNPAAKMKDSGVEWLGDVPAGWEIYRLKYSAGLINQKVDGNEFELPYTGLEHIESWTGKRIVPNGEISSEGQANLYKRGDVLFGKLRPYLAKVHAADADGICTGELLVLRPKAVQQKFLLDYLLNPDVISIVDSSTYGAKMPRANWNFISNLPVLIPPEVDQRAIAEFLDRETARIDALIKKINKSIELLREYRTALISSAVTGKIDVREAAA